MLVSDISDHFSTISRYKIADQAKLITSPSNLPFFRYSNSELSLLNSRLTNQPWDGLISKSDFNRSFDLFYDLVKEGLLGVCNKGPAPHTSKTIAPLNPWTTSSLH